MNKTGIFAIVSIALFLCSSCGKLGYDKSSAHGINVRVSGVDTKASVVTTSTLVGELKEFKMSAYVTQNWHRDVIAPSAEINAGLYVNPWIHGSAEPFKDVMVYLDGTQNWTITGNEINHKDSKGNDYPTFCWVNGVPMRFFAYAPISINGSRSISKADTSVDETYPFSYATKQASAGLVSSADCDDIIFAGATNTAQYGEEQGTADYAKLINDTKDCIDLKFYHALSQVRFCLSTDDGTYDASLKLVKVRILGPQTSAAGVEPVTYGGIMSRGNCVFDIDTHLFAWIDLDGACTYSQDFNADFSTGTPTGWTLGSYTPSGASETKNLYTNTEDVFFIVPQALDGCKIEITFQQGTESPTTVTGKFENVTWDAGKYYTYKIKAQSVDEDEISFSVSLFDWAEREQYIPID